MIVWTGDRWTCHIWCIVRQRDIDTTLPSHIFEVLHVISDGRIQYLLVNVLPLPVQLVFDLQILSAFGDSTVEVVTTDLIQHNVAAIGY